MELPLPELPGIIKKLSLINFLTYDRLDYYPGPGLNVILGVNGSGKSSIICAICIGLGGDPKVLGRSTNIRDYIKRGKDKSVTKISLQRAGARGDVEITRLIKGTNSEWCIDGEKCGKQKVADLVKSLHIQVDNLCQFLAQERVSDFAQQSPKQLLENTELVISTNDKNFHEEHQKLKRMFCDGQDRRTGLERYQTQLTQKLAEKTQLEPDVAQEKERLEIRENINIIKAKASYLKYGEKRTKFQEKKAELEDLRRQKNALETHLAPLMSEANNSKLRYQRSAKEFADLKTKCTSDSQLARDRFEKTMTDEKNALQHVAMELDDAETRVEKRKDDLKLLSDQIASIQRDIEEQPDLTDQQVELDEVGASLRAAEEQIFSITTEIDKLENDLRQKQFSLQKIEITLKSFQRPEVVKINALKRVAGYGLASRVYDWVQANQKDFRGELYGPLCIYINPENREVAGFLEATIDNRDLTGIVCTHKADVINVTRALKQAKILSAVFHAESRPGAADPLRIPPMNDQMKRLGFNHFLLELFTAPDAVRLYLSQTSHLNTIPVGNQQTANNLDACSKVCSASKYNLVLVPGSRLQMSRSRYSGELSTAISDINPASLISPSADETGDIRAAGLEHQGLKRVCDQTMEKKQQLTKRRFETQRTEEGHKRRKSELKDAMKKYTFLSTQLRTKEKQKRQIEDIDVDVASFERRLLERKRDLLIAVGKAVNRYNEVNTKLISYGEKLARLCCGIMDDYKKSAKCENSFNQAKQRVDEFKASYAHEEENLKNFKTAVLELRKTANELCHLKDGNPPPELKEKFNAIPFDVDELDEMRRVHAAKLRCLGDGNLEVMNQYNACLEAINELEHQLAKEHEMVNNYEANLLKHKKAWLDPLNVEIERINRNYGAFFQQMGCAGEVKLVPGEKENDFENYGLKLRVKFRPEEDLQDLTAQRQSGGERSVSTILFMLALQELSRVPFRCVDEINQGMDSTNERRVFNLMTKLLSRDVGASQRVCNGGERHADPGSSLASSQYFMLTPKLLDGLEFSRWTNVFVVCNTGDSDLLLPELSAQSAIEAKRRSKNRKKAAPVLTFEDMIKREQNNENVF